MYSLNTNHIRSPALSEVLEFYSPLQLRSSSTDISAPSPSRCPMSSVLAPAISLAWRKSSQYTPHRVRQGWDSSQWVIDLEEESAFRTVPPGGAAACTCYPLRILRRHQSVPQTSSLLFSLTRPRSIWFSASALAVKLCKRSLVCSIRAS